MRTKPAATALAASLLATVAGPAAAQTYSITYTGSVGGTDTTGYFGGGSLNNDNFALTFTYIVSGVGRSQNNTTDEIYGGSVYPLNNPILSDVLTINGVSLSLALGYYGTDAISGGQFGGYSFTQVSEASGNTVYGILNDSTWSPTVDVTASQYDSIQAPGTQGKLIYNGDTLYLYGTSVSINETDVPEPSTFALFAGAACILGFTARRRPT